MIDAHIHLAQYDFENTKREIENWQSAGIQGVIAVSTDLASSYQTLELQAKFPSFVHAAVGFHPEKPLPTNSDFLEWCTLITEECEHITAIGEIGLPHYSLHGLPHSMDDYIEFLSYCLEIAHHHQLPVALHAVHDKASIVFELLQKNRIQKAHFHWLKAPANVVNHIVNAGYYISVTPEICYRERDQLLASQVPLSQLLIETDGPWPYEDRFKHQQTTPLLLAEILHSLTHTTKHSFDYIQQQTCTNTRKCYNIF